MNLNPKPFVPSDEILEYFYKKYANNIYVVVNKEKTSVCKDPGMNRPFSTRIKKRAEQVARQIGNGAFVATLQEALDHQVLLATPHVK